MWDNKLQKQKDAHKRHQEEWYELISKAAAKGVLVGLITFSLILGVMFLISRLFV